MNTVLIIDVSNVCHRVFHTQVRSLSWDGKQTGVMFGFFRTLTLLMEARRPDNVCFCFDSKESKRREMYPDYKANRQYTEVERRQRSELQKQIRQLRRDLLPELGFVNLYKAEGYEADDLIADLARADRWDDNANEFLIASSDSDLYQLLSAGVVIIQPPWTKLFTKTKFVDKYGFQPKQWPAFKALTGDTADNIKGIPNIGPVTAGKILRGEEVSAKIMQLYLDHLDTVNSNLELIRLPLAGTPNCEIEVQPRLEPKRWRQVMNSIGCRSLLSFTPNSQRTLF